MFLLLSVLYSATENFPPGIYALEMDRVMVRNMMKEQARAEGLAEGKAEGREEGQNMVLELVEQGYTARQIKEKLAASKTAFK